MKKWYKHLSVLLLVVLSFSCSKEAYIEENDSNNNLQKLGKLSTIQGNSNLITPEYANDRLIIQYNFGVSDTTKQRLRLRYGVVSYEECQNCTDRIIELWMFQQGIDIEPKKTEILDDINNGGPGVESMIADVDNEFTFETEMPIELVDVPNLESFEDYIKPDNNGVTIAVFDTGVQPTIYKDGVSVFSTSIPFLYNASGDGNPDTKSGWDFVNHDDNCYDDDPGRHGTIVSHIIHQALINNVPLIPHQILPIKVSNSEGKISYFDFLCGSLFAFKKADILQMSLGWYDDFSGNFFDTIFQNLLEIYPHVLVVTSAGNSSNNNDTRAHYPSGFSNPNIVAVAAANRFTINNVSVSSPVGVASKGGLPVSLPKPDIAYFSNYGQQTVDFFARGENIPFLGHYVNGTSFAAPVVAAKLAKLKHLNPSFSREELINKLGYTGVVCPSSFNTAKKVHFNKIIFP